MIYDEDPLRRRPRESTARRLRHERCVWMARETTKWPSTRWPITKIMSSDGCNGNRVPLEMGPWYDFREFGCHLGNVGLNIGTNVRFGGRRWSELLDPTGPTRIILGCVHPTHDRAASNLLVPRCAIHTKLPDMPTAHLGLPVQRRAAQGMSLRVRHATASACC